MIAERDAVELIEGLERASRRSRPFVISGLVMLLIGCALVIYFLEQQRREALARAETAEQLVETLKIAQRSSAPGELISQALDQAEQLEASLAGTAGDRTEPMAEPKIEQRGPAPAAQQPLREPRQPDPSTPKQPPSRVVPEPPPVRRQANSFFVVRDDIWRRLLARPELLEAQLSSGHYGPHLQGVNLPLRQGVVYQLIPICSGSPAVERRVTITTRDGRLPPTQLTCG